MPIINAFSALTAGVVLGIALVAVIAVAMKLLAPVNAATRSLVWTITLFTLPLIPVLYFAGHRPASAPAAAPLVKAPHPARNVPASPAIPEPQSLIHPGPTAHELQIPAPRNFPLAILPLYLVIAAALLFRLGVSYLRLRLLRTRTEPAPLELSRRVQYWLRRCPTNRPIELRLSHQARSPLAIGWLKPIIVMPAALTLELNTQEFDNLGVHELAHLRRYDDWLNLFQRIIQAVFFFHPAVHYVARKLNFEREVACDDWVVAANGSTSYARCLTKVVELRRYQRGALLLSSGAFFGKRQIIKRVETLLDKTRNAATRISSLTVLAVVVLLAAAASQVPHLPAMISFIEEGNSTNTMRWKDDSRDLTIKSSGELTFSADEKSIAALSPDAFVLIDESKGWSNRRLEVRPGANGAPSEKYFLDGREKSLDGVGRAWAASNYLILLRDAGFDAEQRVNRILAAHGTSGVLSEVDLIHSDNVKLKYLNLVLQQARISEPDLQRLIETVRKISSDGDKANFLLDHRREFSAPTLQTSYFRAVNSIHSDGDRRRVLSGILQENGNSPEVSRLVGLSAKTIESDNDKAEVLLALSQDGSQDTGCALLKAAKTINSDGDKARVLRDTAYVESDICRDAFFAVVNLIQSDGDRASVLRKLLARPQLDTATYQNVANSARAINSDNDKADVLVDLAPRYTESAFFDAANTIQASNDHARVLRSVLDHAPGKSVLLALVESAAKLNGDNEKADVLLAVAKTTTDHDVRLAVQQVSAKLNSDSEYRRVASALLEKGT